MPVSSVACYDHNECRDGFCDLGGTNTCRPCLICSEKTNFPGCAEKCPNVSSTTLPSASTPLSGPQSALPERHIPESIPHGAYLTIALGSLLAVMLVIFLIYLFICKERPAQYGCISATKQFPELSLACFKSCVKGTQNASVQRQIETEPLKLVEEGQAISSGRPPGKEHQAIPESATDSANFNNTSSNSKGKGLVLCDTGTSLPCSLLQQTIVEGTEETTDGLPKDTNPVRNGNEKLKDQKSDTVVKQSLQNTKTNTNQGQIENRKTKSHHSEEKVGSLTNVLQPVNRAIPQHTKENSGTQSAVTSRAKGTKDIETETNGGKKRNAVHTTGQTGKRNNTETGRSRHTSGSNKNGPSDSRDKDSNGTTGSNRKPNSKDTASVTGPKLKSLQQPSDANMPPKQATGNQFQLDLFSNVYIQKEVPEPVMTGVHTEGIKGHPDKEHALAEAQTSDPAVSATYHIDNTDTLDKVPVRETGPPTVQVIDGGSSHRNSPPLASCLNDSGCGSAGGAVGGVKQASMTASEEFRQMTQKHMAERGVTQQRQGEEPLAYPMQASDGAAATEDEEVKKFEQLFPGFIHPSKQRNRWIYDQLKQIDWVLGYYSAGESIEVYVNLGSLDPHVVEQQLADITGADIHKFHAKQNEEPELDYNL